MTTIGSSTRVVCLTATVLAAGVSLTGPAAEVIIAEQKAAVGTADRTVTGQRIQ